MKKKEFKEKLFAALSCDIDNLSFDEKMNVVGEYRTGAWHAPVNIKQGELLCGVADTVLADLKAPGRAQGYF